MNALLWTPSPLDDAVLWLCVNHPPQTMSGVSRALGRKTASLSQNIQKLKSHDFLDRARASMIPTSRGIERVQWLEAHQYDFRTQCPALRPTRHQPLATPAPTTALDMQTPHVEPSLDQVSQVPSLAKPATGVSRVGAGVALMEPRGSIEPPVDRLIDALAGFQDQLLQAANAQLRLRVTELEEEVAALRRRHARTLHLLAQAADAITS